MDDFIDRLINALPNYTPVKSAAKIGRSSYGTLDKMQRLAAALSQYGIEKAKGNNVSYESVAAKKPTFFDVANEIPSEYTLTDALQSMPGITGKYTPTPESAKKIADLLEKTGVTQNFMMKSAIDAGKKDIPVGRMQQIASIAGKQIAKANPVTAAGTALAAGLPIEPTINTDKKVSAMDILKPVAGFVADTATHPLTAAAGIGGLGVKAIKTADMWKNGLTWTQASKLADQSKVGADTWESFGQLYPRVAQMINESFGGSDPEKIYTMLRSPSKFLSPKLQEALMKARRDIGQFTEKATSRVRDWANLDADARKAVGEAVINNNYTILDNFKDKYPSIQDTAANLRRLINQAGLQAVKAGKLSPETFAANKDTYVRRMYQYFENHPEWVKTNNPEQNLELMLTESPITSNVGGDKVNNALFKPRTADEELQQRLGVLGPEHIGYAAGEGSLRTFRSARNSQMFDEIASGISKPSLPEDILKNYPGENLVEKEINAVRQAKKVRVNMFNDVPVVEMEGKQWAKMPDNKGFGSLANKWVPRWDAEHVIGTFKMKGKIATAYDNILNMWKTGKVVLSPAAQGRNLVSNSILMMYSGIPLADAMNHIAKSSKAAMSNNPDYIQRAFIRYGGKGKTWADSEALKFGTGFKNVKAASKTAMNIKDISNIPGNMYSGTENIFKTAIMRYWHEEKGLSLKEAFDKAQETLFDYGDVSNGVEGIKKSLIPFVTFFSKAIPFTSKSALSRPSSVLPLVAMKDVINDHQTTKLGLTDKDRNMLENRFGKWYLITGGTKSKPNIMDLSYIIPGLSDMAGSNGSRGILGKSWIPQALQPSNPFLALLEAQRGVNKAFYFQKPIYSDTDIKFDELKPAVAELVKKGYKLPDAIKTVLSQSSFGKGAGYLWKAFAPANPIIPGTFQGEQLKSALTGMPVFSTGEVQQPKTAIASQIGFKTTPVDMNRMYVSNIREMANLQKELRNELLRINGSKLSDSQKSIKRAAVMLRIKKQIEDLQNYAKTGARNE